MNSARVAGCVPATRGAFPNTFPNVPLVAVTVLGHRAIPIGDAANGLCGGMSSAVRDCAEVHRPPLADPTPPASGSPAFDDLVWRLVDSFELPAGPLRFHRWMSLVDANGAAEPGVASQARGEIAPARAAPAAASRPVVSSSSDTALPIPRRSAAGPPCRSPGSAALLGSSVVSSARV